MVELEVSTFFSALSSVKDDSLLIHGAGSAAYKPLHYGCGSNVCWPMLRKSLYLPVLSLPSLKIKWIYMYTNQMTLFLAVCDPLLKTSFVCLPFFASVFPCEVSTLLTYTNGSVSTSWDAWPTWNQRDHLETSRITSFSQSTEYGVGVVKETLPCTAGGSQRQFLPLW